MYFRNYTLFLSSTYGEPDRNMSQPSYDVLRRIGETISKEFTINPQYDFCAYVPFIMPIIDDLDRALILTSY